LVSFFFIPHTHLEFVLPGKIAAVQIANVAKEQLAIAEPVHVHPGAINLPQPLENSMLWSLNDIVPNVDVVIYSIGANGEISGTDWQRALVDHYEARVID